MELIVDRATIKAPEYIQFYPTLRCNYSCDFCFNRQLPDTQDITIQGFEKLASVCRRSGIGHIDILGGEPTLHPHIEELIGIISENGLMTTISTNGTRPEILNAVSNRFQGETVRIGISLNEGRMPDGLHEYITGHRPIIKTIFTDRGMAEKTMHPYIKMPGIDCRVIFRDAADQKDLESCTCFESFLYHLEAIKKRYPKTKGVFCGGFIPDTLSNPELAETRCPAGTTKLSVLCDGSVYPCYLFFRYKEFCLGNILEDDFSRIWKHPVLEFFRRFSGNQCPNESCRFYRDCRGGCPAMSYLLYKRLDFPDPRCIKQGENVCRN
ncbi:MAG: radical SAM protein [Desulfobacteraceae bacterium]|nr:radical SAM protein [Desulfobacteraceae bacterium]